MLRVFVSLARLSYYMYQKMFGGAAGERYPQRHASVPTHKHWLSDRLLGRASIDHDLLCSAKCVAPMALHVPDCGNIEPV